MRPPTPRLRINSEDFIDNDNGPPGSSENSDTQFLSLHSQISNLTYSTNNTRDTSTNVSTTTYTNQQAIISSYDEKIAVLVADSDIQDISVL